MPPTVSLSSRVAAYENDQQALIDARARLVEAPAQRRAPARGALTGILLGAGLWAAIFALLGALRH